MDLKTQYLFIMKLLFEDKEEWIGPRVWDYLAANPTFLLTILFLCISGLGLLYEYVLFAEFGINVLDYSEAADFFLAAFKRSEAFLTGMVAAGSFLLYRVGANFARKRRSVLLRSILLSICFLGTFRREILVPLGVIYFVVLFAFSAIVESRKLVRSPDSIATISSRFGTPEKFRVILIGTTERFIFGVPYSETGSFSDNTPLIIAIPFTNIVRIGYQNPTLEGRGYTGH